MMKRAFLPSLMVLLFFSLASAQQQHQDVVYSDQLAQQWVSGYWDCPEEAMAHASSLAQDVVVYSGSYAIEVNHACPGGWGAFGVDRRTVDWTTLYRMYPNQYQYLSFWFNPGSSVAAVQALQVTLDNDSPSKLVIDYIKEPLTPNSWCYVSIPLSELNAAEKPFFRVYFFNNSPNHPHYYLDDIVLQWIDDSTPPVISNIAVSDITFASATITWHTDEYTVSTLSYGVDSLTTVVEEADYNKEHTIVLRNLSPSTTYQFHILAKDHQADPEVLQNTAEYVGTFTTAPPDTTPPVISNVSVADLKATQATVYWTTDEPATSRVSYGTHDYSNETADETLTTSHRVVITGLAPETQYQYRLASQDVSGNLGAYEETPPLTFTTTGLSTATLTVDRATDIHPFSANMRGVNLGNWTFEYSRPYPNDSPKLRELTKLIKPGVLRYAGGLASNYVGWDPNNTQCYPGQIKDGQWCDRRPYDPWLKGYDRCSSQTPVDVNNAYHRNYQADEIDALAAFAKYVGANVMVEVNVVTCDPEMWADMAYYTNVLHNYNFKYWELGNELDLERAEGNPRAPFGPEYLSRYKKYYQALKRVDSSILIAGPTTAAHEEDSYFQAFTDFIEPLTNDQEIRQNQMLDVLSYHHYPLWNRPGSTVSYTDMFAYTQATEERSRAHINHCAANKRTLLDSRGFPNTLIAVTEFNAIAADSLTVYTFNHANALYMADTLGRQAYSGADMVMHWELYDRPPEDSYGLIDHNNSTIVRNYLTGEITLQDNFAPMPVYYTYFMYAQFFGNMLVQSSSSREDKLSIWASTDNAEPNTLKLLVVNLTDEPIEATVNIHGFVPGSGKSYELTNQDFVTALDKTTVVGGTSINGLAIDSSSAQTILDSAQAIIDSGRTLGAVGSPFKHVFPAYSVTALVLQGGGPPRCDFNGDGKTDILWRNKTTGQNVVWLMNGANYSSYAELLQVADTNWKIVGTGDFNGDGKTDILWRNMSTGHNVVWLMDGVNYGGYAWLLEVTDTNWQIVGTGDFNGDGKTDILWRNKSTGQNIVWLMNGAALSSYSWIDTVADTNWEIVGTGDFNGDGKTDILWRNKSTGQNIIWLMKGATLSSYSWIDTVADTNWEIVGTGDFNGDGKTDILWRNKSTGQNIVWLMNGTTLSTYAELMQVTDTNWEIVGPE
jgi:hypothetical protein